MQTTKGGIVAPKGFKTAGIHTGVKKRRKDLALIYSEVDAIACGTFTTNEVKASPVLWCKKAIENNSQNIRAIIINSGNANACTGSMGTINTEKMAVETAKSLKINKENVLVSSTGIIGLQLAMDKILPGIKEIAQKLDNSDQCSKDAAEGIMTTDTRTKEIAVEMEIEGKKVKIGAIAKGSGMIHPNMATMLSFITTDINISKEFLNKAIKQSTKGSYNMISVDGDTSTNDMVIVLANGLAGNSKIEHENEHYKKFLSALDYVNRYLAKQIVLDGEGATKFVEVNVTNSKSTENAQKLAKSVVSSNLVKTAIFGEDANWGRILVALGYAGVEFDPEKVSIMLKNGNDSIILYSNGSPNELDEELASKILSNREIYIEANMNNGRACAKAWGCDLSYEYVRINGEYRT